MVSSPAMKVGTVPVLLLALAAAALALPGCASGPTRKEIRTGVEIGPGGRVEGRMSLTVEGLPSLRLYHGGKGVGHVVRTPSGRVLSDGPLESLMLVFDDASCAEGEAIIVLESPEGGRVAVNASSLAEMSLRWDLSRANATNAGNSPPH